MREVDLERVRVDHSPQSFLRRLRKLLDSSLLEQKLLSDSSRFPLLHFGLQFHGLSLLPILVLVDILEIDEEVRCLNHLIAELSEFA